MNSENERIEAAVAEKEGIKQKHLAYVKVAKELVDELREGLTGPSSFESVSLQALPGRVLRVLDGVLEAYAAKADEAESHNEDAQSAVDCMMSFDRLGSQANWPASHVSQLSTIQHLQQVTSDLHERCNRQMSANFELAQSVLELQQQLQTQRYHMDSLKADGLVETGHKLTHQYDTNASSQSAEDNIMSKPAQQTNQPIAPRSTSRFAGLDAEQRQVEVPDAPLSHPVQKSTTPSQASTLTHRQTSPHLAPVPTPTEVTCTPSVVQPMPTPSSAQAPHAKGAAHSAVPKANVVAEAPHAEGPADLAVPKATVVAEQSEVESQGTAAPNTTEAVDQPREASPATVTKPPNMAQVAWGDISASNDTPVAPDSTWEDPSPIVPTNTAGSGGRLPTCFNSRQQPIQSSGQEYRQSGRNDSRPCNRDISQQQSGLGQNNRRAGYNNQGRQNNSAAYRGQNSGVNYQLNNARNSPPKAGGPGQQRGSTGNGPNRSPRTGGPGQQRGSSGNGPNRAPRAGGPGQQRGVSGNSPNNGVRTNGRRQQAGAPGNGQAQNAWVNGPLANQRSAPVTRVDDSSMQRKSAQPTPRLVPVVDSDGFTKAEGRTARQRRKEAERDA